MIIIFDLDGTVIDTSHRYRNGPDGHIDLQYWFDNSTPEQIAKDTLLPLAKAWRRYFDEGHTIVVCTARTFDPSPMTPLLPNPGATYCEFLFDNGLFFDALLHRTMVGDDHASYGDGDLKTKLLNDWAAREGLPEDWRRGAIMFDDNVSVIEKMTRDRLWCIDAVKRNRVLAMARAA